MAAVKKSLTKQSRVRKSGSASPANRISGKRRPTLSSPHVIFEILFFEGILWMVVRNIGTKPALHIRIQFEQEFKGLDGTKRMDTLPLFSQLEFLGPHREIKTFLDRSAAYFCRHEPLKIIARVTFTAENNRKYETQSIHNLEVFRELGFVHFHNPLPADHQGQMFKGGKHGHAT